MDAEGASCNGAVKLEESSREGLITYKRKRARSSPSRDKALGRSPRKEKSRDIGWDHGEIIDGNRFHWMCNWCGLIRYGGGVSRLKKHLAGVCHVRKCPNVPEDIAKLMMNHLVEKQKERAKRLTNRSAHHVNLVNQDNTSQMIAQLGSTNGLKEGAEEGGATGLTKGFTKQGKNIVQRLKSAQTNEAQMGSATGLTNGAEVGTASGLIKGAIEHDETISQKLCSHRKNDWEAQVGSGVGFTEGEAKQDKIATRGSRSVYTSNIKDQVGSLNALTKGNLGPSKLPLKRSNNATQQSKTAIQSPKTDVSKQGMKEIHDKVSCTSTYKQDLQTRINCHWRKVLEHMLKWYGTSEEGGILNCIHSALKFGRSGIARKSEIIDFSAETAKEKDRYAAEVGVEDQHQKPDSSVNAASCASKSTASSQTDMSINSIMCQKVFLDILCSDKFAFLCDLVWINFQERAARFFFDFSLINSRMKNGEYKHSPGLFDGDIQQVWDKFQEVGQQMVLLASSLSSMSHVSSEKQVGGDLVREGDEDRPEETCHIVVEKRNKESYGVAPSTFCESGRSSIPDQTEASCLYKVCTCKQCGAEANAESSLICDGCEGRYHFSCVEPAVKEIPTRSWHCTACSMSKKGSPDPTSIHSRKGSIHQNCVVCDRLEVSVSKGEMDENGCRTAIHSHSRESSVSSMNSDKAPELSRTALSCLCKLCGMCEDEDKKFLVCGHTQCPFKFYHIRCLKSSQIASLQQQNRLCWYCPSCLCRACLCDKDDDQIVLCDGCDEAYHTYCMKPPCSSIPRGQWHCLPCNIARAKEGMKRYEQWILQQHGKNDVILSRETNRSMDLLLSAAEKLKSEEVTAGS